MREQPAAVLFELFEAFIVRMPWADVAARGGDTSVAEDLLARLPEVGPLDALTANKHLVELLVGDRWYVMQAAREAGATWSQIGAALGMSKQGAQDWYRRKIADQEQHASDFHDVERARAAL